MFNKIDSFKRIHSHFIDLYNEQNKINNKYQKQNERPKAAGPRKAAISRTFS